MHPASFISSFKRVISVLVLLVLVISGVLFLSRALAITDGPEKNGAFLRDDRQYDVLLFGSSHMVNGIYPMELWKNYGITAYDLGGHGASLAASYWEMRLAVEKHKPKVAVLDVLFAGSDYTEMEMGLAHELFDPYPLSRLKIQAVRDIFANKGDRMELLFPLDVYHNRWKELDTEMVERGLTGRMQACTEKGSEIRVGTVALERIPLLPETDRLEARTIAMDYIEKIIIFCQENDIIPVLVYIPGQISEEWQRACNAAMALGEALGAKTLNQQYMDLIDFNTDWYDEGRHLNPSGALKATHSLGAFLQDQCGLESHLQDSACSAWQEDYRMYVAYLTETMQAQTDPDQFLSLAALECFTVEATISPDFSDQTVLHQLQSLGVTPAIRKDGPDLELIIRDTQGNELVHKWFETETTLTETVEA